MFHFSRGTLNLNIGEDTSLIWQDKSIGVLTNDYGQSISISYGKIPFGMTFIEFCDREVNTLRKQFSHFKELSRTQGKISELECVYTEFCWDAPQGHFHQLTAIINMVNKMPVMITATVLGEMSLSQKELFLGIIQTFKPRNESIN